MPGMVIPKTGAQLQGPIFSNFVPKAQLITGITNEVNAIVTTASAHGYETGMVVTILIPPTYQLPIDVDTYIIVLTDTTFQTQINTSEMDTFVAPTSYPPIGFTPAQCIPVSGETQNIATPVV